MNSEKRVRLQMWISIVSDLWRRAWRELALPGRKLKRMLIGRAGMHWVAVAV